MNQADPYRHRQTEFVGERWHSKGHRLFNFSADTETVLVFWSDPRVRCTLCPAVCIGGGACDTERVPPPAVTVNVTGTPENARLYLSRTSTTKGAGNGVLIAACCPSPEILTSVVRCAVIKPYLNPFRLHGGDVCVDGGVTQRIATKDTVQCQFGQTR